MRSRRYIIGIIGLLGSLVSVPACAEMSLSTTTSLVQTYSSYSASFYPSKIFRSMFFNGGQTNDSEYYRSYELFKSAPTSPYRTQRYSDIRKQYDNVVNQRDRTEKREIQLQNQYNQTVFNRHRNDIGGRNRNRSNTTVYYDTERDQLRSQLNQIQSQLNSFRLQEQNLGNQLLTEELVIYEKSLGDEKYLKKFLESYALAGVKKAKQGENLRAQLKAREEEQKMISEWQAMVTFEYLSKYSTLKTKYENKEISFNDFEQGKEKLEKEKIDKLRQSQREGREAYNETLERLTTAVDTSAPKPNF